MNVNWSDELRVLDRVGPSRDLWADALARAASSPLRRGRADRGLNWASAPRLRPPRRRVVLIAVAAAVIIAPLTAISAVNHWWFLRASLPRPAHTPVVVTRGSWSGHRWTLVAYPSKGYGLCWGVTFAGHTHASHSYKFMRVVSAGTTVHGADDAMGCGAIVGLRHWDPADLPTVMFESETTRARGYPSWISGAVAPSATHVVIRWQLVGKTVRARTFAAPVAGYHVRLFAVPAVANSPILGPSSISGTNKHGHVVACWNSRIISTNGVYPLSYCKP